jgi:hypothetical protein
VSDADRLRVLRARTEEPDPCRALEVLARALEADCAQGLLLFCSDQYDLERLGPAIARTFTAPVAACTARGQIGPSGFATGGITGVSLRGDDVSMRTHLLSPLSLCQSQAASLARDHAARTAARSGSKTFGVLLVDGASMWEDFVAAALYEALGDVTLVGGSTAATQPAKPAVYFDGRFRHGAAVVALCESRTISFASFSAQHFEPSVNRLVITLADPDRRIVYEINGVPAARAYAKALGVAEADLDAQHFACNPLLLDLGDQLLARAIRGRAPDGSLQLAGAIEEGLVVSIAQPGDPLATLRRTLADVERRVPRPEALLVFDSSLRRLELETRGLDSRVGQLLAEHRAIGFNSYGEQLGPLHTNHTLTGLALGSAHAREAR